MPPYPSEMRYRTKERKLQPSTTEVVAVCKRTLNNRTTETK
jgi:hypothetical protein